jgi:hypothetical protein
LTRDLPLDHNPIVRPRTVIVSLVLFTVIAPQLAFAQDGLTPTTGTQTVQVSLVHCTNAFDCWLARRITPRALIDQRPLVFENDQAIAFTITDAHVTAFDPAVNEYLGDTQLILPATPINLPTQRIITIPMDVDRDSLRPGHYTGLVVLAIEGQEQPVKLSLDVTVRSGPTWALLAILIGIVVGFLFRWGFKKETRENLSRTSGTGKLLAAFPGINQATDRKALRVFGYLVIVAVVIGLGLNKAYLNAGSTWGANQPVDFVSLLGFGFAADLSGNSLLGSAV